MSRGTFWCLVITTELGVALMFVVKLAKNFKKKHFQIVSAKIVISFLGPKDQQFIP